MSKDEESVLKIVYPPTMRKMSEASCVSFAQAAQRIVTSAFASWWRLATRRDLAREVVERRTGVWQSR